MGEAAQTRGRREWPVWAGVIAAHAGLAVLLSMSWRDQPQRKLENAPIAVEIVAEAAPVATAPDASTAAPLSKGAPEEAVTTPPDELPIEQAPPPEPARPAPPPPAPRPPAPPPPPAPKAERTPPKVAAPAPRPQPRTPPRPRKTRRLSPSCGQGSAGSRCF